jgi:hypothetical protein
MQLGGDDEPPTPPVEVLDVNDLPTPPLPLDAPVSQGARARSASPDIIDVDDLDDDSFMRRADEQQSRSGSLSDSDVEVGTDSDSEVFLVGAERSRDLARPRSDLAAAPPDISSLLTESQRRRLAPVQPLQRKRRSRKIRREEQEEETFIPLVRGARATQDEAILNAYNGETLETKREQGEDYWVDPEQVQNDIRKKEAVAERRKAFKAREVGFKEERLKKEITAPYKNNLIGLIVVGVGVAAVVFAMFPGLLELPPLIASFPDTL